ncbi:multicopper oxidase [Mollisia scopiformis]|uniref:Multicopper oxidase n=1 Tax=Mollisia scopiformis TaxID=149040 RepID=A0A194XMY3_MOLSC|nr:multicopper oxidase [Mollisia scopiformis]KUJ21486.1 multicopper oxidase [Mollisia scopiformis]
MKYLCVLAWLSATLAATVTYNWDINWVEAAPDGFKRPVIGINGQWPCPTIEANLGDTIIVHVYNGLVNETTGIHFHGQTQTGTGTMDGPSGVNQCSIPPGGTFTYNFTANPAGSFWYHSHNKGQYPDGLRGPLIIHDPKDVYAGSYDEELTLTLSDWYYKQMPVMLPLYLNPDNSAGVEPAPNSTLVNDSQNITFAITPGKTYRLRVISVGNFVGQIFEVEDHEMTIIAVDSVPVHQASTSSIYVSVGQRFDVLFTAKPTATKNYFFISSIDQSMIGGDFEITYPNAYGYLVYNPKPPLPAVYQPTFSWIDDFTLVPYDNEPILGTVDHQIVINMNFTNDAYDINRAVINGQTYVTQIVPSLYTVLSAPAVDVMNPLIYGNGSNPFVVQYDQVVEIVINNYDTGSHPWYMHGHQFQVVYRGAMDTPFWDGTQPVSAIPVRRDVVMVNTMASAVWRFKANNPGVFLIHCHIEWHVEAGLQATLFEAPDHLQGALTIPADHLKVCKTDNTPTVGNAAGNSKNWLDLAGAPVVAPRYDYGSLVTPPATAKMLRSRADMRARQEMSSWP